MQSNPFWGKDDVGPVWQEDSFKDLMLLFRRFMLPNVKVQFLWNKQKTMGNLQLNVLDHAFSIFEKVF